MNSDEYRVLSNAMTLIEKELGEAKAILKRLNNEEHKRVGGGISYGDMESLREFEDNRKG